jgi:hypothetical protein
MAYVDQFGGGIRYSDMECNEGVPFLKCHTLRGSNEKQIEESGMSLSACRVDKV